MPTYCFACNEMVELVATDENAFAAHCPRCGRLPGPIERGLETMPDAKTRAALERRYAE